MVDLNAHEAGNGGQSQGKPTACGVLLYSEGYDRIVGALANLGHQVSDQTVGHILRRHNIAPAPERSRTTTWKEFIRSHTDVLAGADFFTVEVLSWHGLVTYYVLFFMEVGSRRVSLGGITRHPDSSWMAQVARNATMQDTGYLNGCRYLLHDRDKKFCHEFRETLAASGVECTPIPARSPNLNAHAERWVRSIKDECLSKLILFGENSLWRDLSDSWSIITKRETTKANITSCSSPLLCRRQVRGARSVVESGSVAYSNTTTALHELFSPCEVLTGRSRIS